MLVVRLPRLALVGVLLLLVPSASAVGLGGVPALPFAPSTDASVAESAVVDLTPVLAGLPADTGADEVRVAVAQARETAVADALLARKLAALEDASAPVALLRAIPDVPPLVVVVPVPVIVPDVPVVLAPAAPVTAPAAGFAIGAAASAALTFAFPPGLFGRFYSRLGRTEVLDNPVRRRVFDAIAAKPGVSLSDVGAATDLANGALLHHVDVLRREGLVTRVAEGRFVRLFVTGQYSPGEMRRRAVVLSGSPGRLLGIIRDRPGLAVRDAASSLGLSVPATHRSLRRLEDAGLIERRREGRAHALYPAPVQPAAQTPTAA